jgi:hypothetical protein
MIYINHSKQAIFIHIPKTGGTYIGPTLEKYYGFTSYLQLLHNRRPDHESYCGVKHFKKVLTGNRTYDFSFFNKAIGILVYCKTSPFLSNMMNMTDEKWRTYKKFCFIRNPYTRALSGWKHMNIKLNRNMEFYDYINQNPYNVTDIEYGHVFMSQKRQIQDESGNCGVDIIGRFEYLEEDFQEILQSLGFDKIIHKVERKNVSNEEGSDKVLYEARTVEKLNEIFKDDFESFHYIAV